MAISRQLLRRARPSPVWQFPGNRIPAERIDAAARRILEFFYPLRTRRTWPPAATARIARFSHPGTRSRPRRPATGSRAVRPRFAVRARQLAAAQPRRLHLREHRRQRSGLTNLGLLDRQSKATTFAGGWTRIWRGAMVSEFRGGYSRDYRIEKPFRRRAGRCGTAPRGAAAGGRGPGLPLVPVLRHESPVRHSRPAAERLPRSRSVVGLVQQQLGTG